MTSILGTETHRYDFNEGSGPILDKVGSADSTSIVGSPSFNGNSVTYDGVDDSHQWSLANTPYDPTADMTFYIKFRILEDPSDKIIRFYGANPGGNDGPTGQWQSITGSGTEEFGTFMRPGGGDSIVKLDIGRLPNNTEIWVQAWSWDETGKDQKAIIQSNDSINPVILSGSSASTLNEPLLRAFDLAQAFGEFGNIEVFQMGSVNGTAHSIQDLLDTADALLANGNGEETGGIFPDNGIITTTFNDNGIIPKTF